MDDVTGPAEGVDEVPEEDELGGADDGADAAVGEDGPDARDETADAGGRGRLVLVATPIGNLDDLSPRAVATLREADVIACEDTRHSGRLLAHAGIDRPLMAVHEHNESARVDDVVSRVREGQVVAVITDAGTPGISDPGFVVARAVADAGLQVTAVPGPAAFVHALVISGLPTDRFAFEGFLPRRAGARRQHLAEVADDPRTLLFYVAPHRAADDLRAMAEAFGGDRPAALARELTKRFEEVWRGTLDELAVRAAETPPRGEVTVVVGPAAPQSAEATAEDVAQLIAQLMEEGLSRRDAVREAADRTGLPKSDVYDIALGKGGGS